MYTGEKGNISEAKILSTLVEAGYVVSVPFGAGHKYDLIIDDGSRLWRAQCKTGRAKDGILVFNAYSQSGNGSQRANYRDVADVFLVLNPTDGKVYFLPVNEVGITTVSLRLLPTENNQSERVRWAEPYLLKSANKCKESILAWAS